MVVPRTQNGRAPKVKGLATSHKSELMKTSPRIQPPSNFSRTPRVTNSLAKCLSPNTCRSMRQKVVLPEAWPDRPGSYSRRGPLSLSGFAHNTFSPRGSFIPLLHSVLSRRDFYGRQFHAPRTRDPAGYHRELASDSDNPVRVVAVISLLHAARVRSSIWSRVAKGVKASFSA